MPQPANHLMDEYLSTPTLNPPHLPPPARRRRSLPGQPDPDAEVIAMSPKSLMATNRFTCKICNKGFHRDQNLQLHMRGHNLPWKLKRRPRGEAVKKKVYVCPDLRCVHNDPARALGDLTGVKKHFFRKHMEKKWQCEKCLKKYAIHSDWKVHSKICDTKKYTCDCGTIFSRKDTFKTHKALCDAIEKDASTPLTSNPFLPPTPQQHEEVPTTHEHLQNMAPDPNLIPENMENHVSNLIPTWLQAPPVMPSSFSSPAFLFSHELIQPPLQLPHMSATALLQKAAELGALMSSETASTMLPTLPHLTLSSLEQEMGSNTLGFFSQEGGGSSSSSSSVLRDIAMMKSSFGGDNAVDYGGIGDGLTRDFLGLGPLIPHGDDTNVASSSSQEHGKVW